MKFKFYAVAPLWGAMALLVATGCTDELVKEQQQTVLPTGNGIVFEATAAYASDDAQTRTSYGDYDNPANPTSQAINWEEDDKVDIYSPTSPTGEASGKGKKAEYDITLTDGKAYLTCNTQGLQWGDETQSFYGIYPAVESMSNAAVKERVSFEGTVLKGYVPVNQQHTITKTGNTWTATPNMDYLYMAARATDEQKPVEANQGVKLDFQPLTSTLEITFVGPMDHPMASFNVFANDGEAIAGNFSCDLTDEDFTCTPTSQGVTSTYVTVSTYWNDNGTQKPLQLGEGESITFNVFLLPHDNLDNLSVRVAGFNAASVTAQLTENSGSLVVYPHKKSIVKLPAPKSFGNTNSWVSGLPNNVLISQLSIPGTANSFSYLYKDDNAAWYQTQTADITQQWNAGIRCFELVCPEKVGDGEAFTNLDDSPIQCNRTNVGINFGAAVDEIWDLVQNTGEFAMIIPAYESMTGHPADYNGVKNFMDALNEFYRTHTSYNYVTYGSNVTLEEARGALMFVARITSEEDGEYEFDLPPLQGVVVYQWGSLKDLWKRRGYSGEDWAIQGNPNHWGEGQIEYKMINPSDSHGFSVYEEYRPWDDPSYPFISATAPSIVDTGANQFERSSVRSDGTSGTAWVHYWPRVVKTSGFYPLYSHDGLTGGVPAQYTRSYYIYWQESFQEKCEDVVETFHKAITDNSGKKGDMFYINSLDGFYVDDNIPASVLPYVGSDMEFFESIDKLYVSNGNEMKDTYNANNWKSVTRTTLENYNMDNDYWQGGVAGNIKAYATDINNYFYNYILDFGEDNIYGPMNVVMMDMVYSDEPSSYLPSVIINNNYRFPLKTNEENANQSESQFNNGGNAIK